MLDDGRKTIGDERLTLNEGRGLHSTNDGAGIISGFKPSVRRVGASAYRAKRGAGRPGAHP